MGKLLLIILAPFMGGLDGIAFDEWSYSF